MRQGRGGVEGAGPYAGGPDRRRESRARGILREGHGHIVCAVPQPPHERKLPESVRIREVGPRDGLQVEEPVPPEVRARLIASLAETGIKCIEAVSFVSEKAVPSMAQPEAVLEELGRIGVRSDLTLTALVPNRRGAERALGTDVAELTVTISVSEEYNQTKRANDRGGVSGRGGFDLRDGRIVRSSGRCRRVMRVRIPV